MKCCGSPTTSSVVNAADASRMAVDTMQAVLFSEILKPLSKTLGPVGDMVVASVSQTLFMRPRP